MQGSRAVPGLRMGAAPDLFYQEWGTGLDRTERGRAGIWAGGENKVPPSPFWGSIPSENLGVFPCAAPQQLLMAVLHFAAQDFTWQGQPCRQPRHSEPFGTILTIFNFSIATCIGLGSFLKSSL